MNHNYYYVLLSKRATGVATSTGCTSTSKQLRYSTLSGQDYVGSTDPQASAIYALAFGYTVEVWTQDWASFGNGSRLYLDAALSQAFSSAGSGLWFTVEGTLFYYDNVAGVQNFQPAAPVYTSASINAGDSNTCMLDGPFITQIWADQDNWQLVSRVWTDAARTQPLAGGNLWYGVDPYGSINAMGTTIQINNCGQIIGLYAC